jgi:hypothetical protein
MIRSFKDEFNITDAMKPPNPAQAGDILRKDDGSKPLVGEDVKMYRTGVGKLMHMRLWSRNDILNRNRELTRFLSCPTEIHFDRMKRVMAYVNSTSKEGNIIRPERTWNGRPDGMEF